jgi:Beta-galactosidase
MKHNLNLKKIRNKKIERLSDNFCGNDPDGNEIAFTNYYMLKNGKPFFAISGECHFSRVHERQWEDTILKMKMGGLNIVSTYIFWNHHEEIEGQFRFDGNRNVKKFIQICQKHGMYVIVRVGPFVHGEARNGGLPDWLYHKPFDVRSMNAGFLYYTRRLYQKLAEQFTGLYYKDGGAIIGTQIENEYMHSAAPWEMTTGVSNEWVPGGSDGNDYMRKLKKIAQEEGICTPFYTCTAWGGAMAPVDEMLPLWGGYAFWPWIFYDYDGEHPATPEYIYRDNHNNEVPVTYNFEPTYQPESLPYSCCEMGGGMSCYYNYRFQLPYESVDAMANIKLAGGCNFLGYYMYRGGSHPKGESMPYLNEHQCPKISYDYQAAIGEYGQLRPSYYRLKALHLFAKNFQDKFCETVTVLPDGSQEIAVEDIETLRYAVRTDGSGGFVFLNNYQDHIECKAKKDEVITLTFGDKEIVIPKISLAAGEEAILPFGMDIEGYQLIYAKAQPLSIIKEDGRTIYFFFIPEGMEPEYLWEGNDIEVLNGEKVNSTTVSIAPATGKDSVYKIAGKYGEVEIVTLTRAESLMFYEIEVEDKKTAVLCDSPFTYDGTVIRVESPPKEGDTTTLWMYPACGLQMMNAEVISKVIEADIWTGIELQWDKKEIKTEILDIKKCGSSRYTVQIPDEYEKCKDALMQIEYHGDIGHAFINSELVSDNFSNRAVWEIGLKEVWKPEDGTEVLLAITPLKENVKIDVSSTMAGRMETDGNSLVELFSVKIKPIQEVSILVTK